MKFVVFALVLLLGGLFHVLTRARRQAAAMRAQCLCCDSFEVTEDDAGHELCHRCGFSTEWSADPTRATMVEVMRSLGRARDDLLLGLEALNDPSAQSGSDRQALASHYELSALGHLQQASELDPTLLEDLALQPLSKQLQRVEASRASVRALLVA